MDLPGCVPVLPGKVPSGASGDALTAVVENDLPAAIQLQIGMEVKVLYPEGRHSFQMNLSQVTEPGGTVQICLRDEPRISGTDKVLFGAPRIKESACFTLRAGFAFGSFGEEVLEFLRLEQMEVHRERELKKEREKMLQEQVELERKNGLRFGCPYYFSAMLCSAVGLGLCACASIIAIRNAFTVSFLSVVSVFFLAVLLFFGLMARTRGAVFHLQSLRLLSYHCPLVCMILGSICVITTVIFSLIDGFWWSALIAVPAFCYLGWMKWRFCSNSMEEEQEASMEIDAQRVADRTIVFHGSILKGRGRPCVCSWPGKYASAWDALVQFSRNGDLSAAVVFLPQGSENFGSHDPIPKAEGIEGDCWCDPLYGEKKPWGCRWWSKWIANIELAMKEGANLHVYFFKGMKGKGKVEDFSTAGREHLQREEIQLKKKEHFPESPEFKVALEGGIQKLSKEVRADASSQYSREVDRLFLAWLPDEERKVIEAAEGLGNSQKAEVAWLKRKGYDYTEMEVDVSQWIGEQAIRQWAADEP